MKVGKLIIIIGMSLLLFGCDNEVDRLEDKVDLLEDTVKEEIPQKLERKGSLEKNTFKADEVNSSGIKLVDLDKNDGPKDELTFNIFENLNDDDIKKMLEEQIDDEKYDKE